MHSEGKSHARSFVGPGLTNMIGPNILKNVMQCSALPAGILHHQLMAKQMTHL